MGYVTSFYIDGIPNMRTQLSTAAEYTYVPEHFHSKAPAKFEIQFAIS
jgi:hypothetical protein